MVAHGSGPNALESRRSSQSPTMLPYRSGKGTDTEMQYSWLISRFSLSMTHKDL